MCVRASEGLRSHGLGLRATGILVSLIRLVGVSYRFSVEFCEGFVEGF